jgi:hypothetical protein
VYYVGPIITSYGRITARKYVDRVNNHMHPMIQTLFPNHAGTVQSWLEEHEGELQHLPWTVSEIKVRYRFPLPTSLKQLEDVFQEEWYRISLETLQNLYEPLSRTAAVLKANGGPTPY